MSKPEPTIGALAFDLSMSDRAMREEDAYVREGHTARTLTREHDMRIVLIVMKAASRIAEHRANQTVSIHALSGHLRVHIPNRTVEVPAGQLLVLERGVHHDVEAVVESAFLLTMGWHKAAGP